MRPALTFSATLLALLLLLEFVLRTWLVAPLSRSWDEELGELNRPGARIVMAREGHGVHRINRLGLIGPELDTDRTRRRLLLLGNSFTEALNLPRDRGLAGRLERHRPAVEVVNAAHSGHKLAHQLVLFERLLEPVDPDLVALQLIDAAPFVEGELHLGRTDTGWRIVPAPVPGDLRARIKGITDPAASRSALLTMVLQRAHTLLVREEHDAPVQDLARYRSAARWIVERIDRRGRPLVLFVVPTLDYGLGRCVERRPRVRAIQHELAAELGLPLVDPTEAFCAHYLATREPAHGFHNLVVGEGHLNAIGHRILAAELAEALP